MVNVLFVCLGNCFGVISQEIFVDHQWVFVCSNIIIAEAVFAHLVSQHSLQSKFGKIDSAGTAGYHINDAPDPRTIDICKAHGVPIDHVGQQLSSRDFDQYDWILVMDHVDLDFFIH